MEYRATLERGMKQYAESLLSDGMLPVLARWRDRERFRYVPGALVCERIRECWVRGSCRATRETYRRGNQDPQRPDSRVRFEKCFALFVLTQTESHDDFTNESHELYLYRNLGSDEERALLAIALHRQNIMAREQEQLLREIDVPIKERAFNPATFTSMTRAEAMRTLAFDVISPPFWTKQRKQQARDRMSKLMDSAGSLSTQENLWLLLAFKSMLGTEAGHP